MKEMVLKIAIILALLTFALCGCGKKDAEPVDTRDPNIPANTVSRAPETTPEATSPDEPVTEPQISTEPEVTVTQSSEPDSAETDPAQSETKPAQTEPEPEPSQTEQVDDEPLDTMAMQYLGLLNSSRVHAKFLQIISYDGEGMVSIEREYFVNGDERIYVNDDSKTLIRGGRVTVVNYDDGTYYSYSDTGSYGIDFGFERRLYKLVSSGYDNDGVYTETYAIDGTGITSTWYFDNGSLRVADRNIEAGNYELYTFEFIENSADGMDFTVPEQFTEVDPDDYTSF